MSIVEFSKKIRLYKLLRLLHRGYHISLKFLSIAIPSKRICCSKKTLRCESDFLNKNYRYYIFGKDTPICCITHLFEILRDITWIFKENNIEYFIFYGTHLGAVRHKGFIPWDTDIDICVMAEHREKCLEVLKHHVEKTYPIKKIEDHWMMVNYSENNGLHADIYFMNKSPRGVYLKDYEEYLYSMESIFPLKTIELYGIEVTAPRSNEPLYVYYGDDCLRNRELQYSYLKRAKVEDFTPAKIDSRYLTFKWTPIVGQYQSNNK